MVYRGNVVTGQGLMQKKKRLPPPLLQNNPPAFRSCPDPTHPHPLPYRALALAAEQAQRACLDLAAHLHRAQAFPHLAKKNGERKEAEGGGVGGKTKGVVVAIDYTNG